MKRKFSRLLVLTGIVGFALVALGFSLYHHSTRSSISDSGFVLLDQFPSPNGLKTIVVYQYDTGALGYSRVFWSIAPPNLKHIDLDDYLLPDGYQACGWTRSNGAILIPWNPYYYKAKPETVFQSGDVFKSVKIKIVPNPDPSNQGAYSKVHQSL